MVGEEVLAGSTAPILTMFSSEIGYGEVRPGYSVGDTKIKESGGRGGLMTRMLLQATTTMGWSIAGRFQEKERHALWRLRGSKLTDFFIVL